MILRSIYLQHFRNYPEAKFDFSPTFTVVVGKNTAGKTNLSEAIHLLCLGKSFRTSRDEDMIGFGEDIGRVGGLFEESKGTKGSNESKVKDFAIVNEMKQSNIDSQIVSAFPIPHNDESIKAELILAKSQATSGRFSKKFLLNGIPKSRASFATILPLVLFRPEELDIIIDGPSLRRDFLDSVLEQVDREYASSWTAYFRALRQRNALLDLAKEQGYRNKQQFEYWDTLLIENGQILTKKREEFIEFVNNIDKDIFDFQMVYDHSKISEERLAQYEQAEVGAGNTLVGPHRDDFWVEIGVGSTPAVKGSNTSGVLLRGMQKDARHFGSRGQQRLVVLQLKLLEIQYIQEKTGKIPLLVLDDIFSELDSGHISLVLEKVKGCQTILTTTHKEFIPTKNYYTIDLLTG